MHIFCQSLPWQNKFIPSLIPEFRPSKKYVNGKTFYKKKEKKKREREREAV